MTTAAGDKARARAATAARRVQEIERRLRSLRAGVPTVAGDVRRAEQSARLERVQNAAAHDRAARAHLSAADGHRRASTLLDVAGLPAQAAEHRLMAALDDEAARRDAHAARLALRS